ncbi:MAG: phage integrase N-terminal SAM-like domain-containing protein [Nitrospiraceae bacterium]|nr:phage integrase N-terminal SAM-like domain-containing protein [Nitrospiraceae bacterium]
MNIKDTVELYKEHQRTTLKVRTQESYRLLLEKFQEAFSDRKVDSIKAEEILQFFETGTSKLARSTRHLRYAQLKAFFSFALDVAGSNIQNPCNSSLLSKAFKATTRLQRKFLIRRRWMN